MILPNFNIRQLYKLRHTILERGFYDVFTDSKFRLSQRVVDAVIVNAFEKIEDLIVLYRHVLTDISYRSLLENMRYNFRNHIDDIEDNFVVFSSPLSEDRNVSVHSLIKILEVIRQGDKGQNILHLYTLIQINNAVIVDFADYTQSDMTYIVVKNHRGETEYIHISNTNHEQFLAVLTYTSLL